MADYEKQKVVVKFDGKEVFMVPFVERMILGVVMGLMDNVKGYEKGKKVTIEISEE